MVCLKGPIANNRYSLNMSSLRIEIIRRVMLHNSVIPHHDRIDLPLDAALNLSLIHI